MITGVPPFFENDEDLLQEKIKTGVWSTRFPNFEKNNSEEVRDLIYQMMQIDIAKRISIENIFTHAWFSKFAKTYLTLSKNVAYDVLANMKSLKVLYGF